MYIRPNMSPPRRGADVPRGYLMIGVFRSPYDEEVSRLLAVLSMTTPKSTSSRSMGQPNSSFAAVTIWTF